MSMCDRVIEPRVRTIVAQRVSIVSDGVWQRPLLLRVRKLKCQLNPAARCGEVERTDVWTFTVFINVTVTKRVMSRLVTYVTV